MTTLVSQVGTLKGLLDTPFFQDIKGITTHDVEATFEFLKDISLPENAVDIGRLNDVEKTLFVYGHTLALKIEGLESHPTVVGGARVGLHAFLFIGVDPEQEEAIDELRAEQLAVTVMFDKTVKARLKKELASRSARRFNIQGDFKVFALPPCPNCGRYH